MVGERVHDLTGGNQSLAAQHLGIPRRTFCRKLNEYHITFGRRSGFSRKAAPALPVLFRAELEVPVQVTTKERRSFSAQARKLSVGDLGLRNFRSPTRTRMNSRFSSRSPALVS